MMTPNEIDDTKSLNRLIARSGSVRTTVVVFNTIQYVVSRVAKVKMGDRSALDDARTFALRIAYLLERQNDAETVDDLIDAVRAYLTGNLTVSTDISDFL